ncbi:MAG: lytic murein transglycosylase [Ramlibacter sp.]
MALRFLRSAAAAALLVPFASFAQSLVEQPMPPGQFQSCVQQLASQTGTAGRPIARDDFLRIAGAARYDDRVRQAMLVQTAEPSYWWDAIAATTDDERVQEGRRIMAANADLLQRIEERFGIPRQIVVAIYGIETNFGPSQGRIPVLDAAVTYACLRPCPPDAQRACIARERAYAAARLVRDNKVRPESWQGSWAAAFGRTQFVPDSFEQLAVDFDGDGTADIVNSVADALATTANHLRERGGWAAGSPVYLEVRVPPAQEGKYPASDRSIRLTREARPLSAWAAEGWRGVGAGGQLLPLQHPGDPEVYPFLPVGLPGPAFLATSNFNTIYRYNNSDKYVMEVAVLADRIAGGPGIVTPWPTDDPGLSRAQVRELQAWLQQRGHALVTPDGVMGRNTRDAIEAERAARGMPPGRRVGQRTLRELMGS